LFAAIFGMVKLLTAPKITTIVLPEALGKLGTIE
jgi:hypothetical protein